MMPWERVFLIKRKTRKNLSVLYKIVSSSVIRKSKIYHKSMIFQVKRRCQDLKRKHKEPLIIYGRYGTGNTSKGRAKNVPSIELVKNVVVPYGNGAKKVQVSYGKTLY